MIKSFKHKGLKKFFEEGTTKGIQAKHKIKLKLILDYLDAMESILDINIPSLRLHLLEPKQNNIYSITVSGNWRITFKFADNNVYIVDYLDYH
jgi:proteic killer suppression protein